MFWFHSKPIEMVPNNCKSWYMILRCLSFFTSVRFSFGNWRQKLSSILLFDNITFLFGGTPVGITKRYRKVFARRKKHLREHFFMITACCRTHQMAMKNSGAFVFLRLCSFSTKEWSLSKRWKNFRYVRSKFSMLTFFIAS